MAVRKLSSPDTTTYHTNVIGNKYLDNGNNDRNIFSTAVLKPSTFNSSAQHHMENTFVLGHLDGLVSSPNRCGKVRVTDSRKIAAILLETNNVELQRHLLTITVQNQVG